MSTRIKGAELVVSWSVSDGYIGPPATHETRIPLEELEDLDREGVEEVVRHAVESDFRERISPSLDFDEVMRVLREKENGQ